jgi:hypothetical protein
MGNILNVICDDITCLPKPCEDFFARYDDITLKFNQFEDLVLNPNIKYYSFHYYSNYITSQIYQEGGLIINEKIIKNLIENKNYNFVFLNENESESEDVIELITKYFGLYNVDINQIYVINGNQKLHELKTKLNSNINVHTTHYGEIIMSSNMSAFDYDVKLEKEYLFMSYNRYPKSHRTGILCILKKLNLLSETDWTWLRGEQFNNFFDKLNNNKIGKWYFEGVFEEHEVEDLANEIEYLKSINHKKSKFEKNYEIDFPPYGFDWTTMWRENTFKNSYVNIVGETNYESNNVVMISEKSLIPLYYSQIPIIVASPNHIETMKNLYDFDFFEDIIDINYDSEKDNRKRFGMIINQIKKISENKSMIIDFYKNNVDRFLLNKEKIKNIKNSNLDYLFFKSLTWENTAQ